MKYLLEVRETQCLQGFHMRKNDFKKLLFFKFLWIAIRKMV